jgi:alpha-methylacyl-CoA racemase
VAGRIGAGWETPRKINGKLVYCSISWYGQEGPYRDLPGHDINYMTMAMVFSFFRNSSITFALNVLSYRFR